MVDVQFFLRWISYICVRMYKRRQRLWIQKNAISILSKPTQLKLKLLCSNQTKRFSIVDIGQILDIVRKTRV